MDKIMRCLLPLLLVIPLFAQDITISKEEMLNIANNIKQLQADSASVANSLSICEDYAKKLESHIKTDSLLLLKKNEQIELLKERDEANEKMVKLIKPEWYEHRYLWLIAGIFVGRI